MQDSNQPGSYEEHGRRLSDHSENLRVALEHYKAVREKATKLQRMTESEFLLLSGVIPENHPEHAPLISQRKEERRAANEEEAEASRRVDIAREAHEEANRAFLTATAEPRVEATKLRFEEHKLRATLSSASIVGIAATSGILLPDRLEYLPVLAASFLCLFLSTVLSLEAMKTLGEYVEDTLIHGAADEPRGVVGWLTRHTFTLGLLVFAAFMVLNLAVQVP